MKNTLLPLLSALLVSMPSLATAAELRIYQMNVRGPAPELKDFTAAMDEKSMPGLVVYSTYVQDDGKVLLDLTRGDLPAPDPEAKDPRRVGVLIKGQLSPAEKDAGRRINLRIRDCKHTAYLYGAGDRKFYPSLTESSVEVIARFSKDGWAMFEMDAESGETRTVYVMRLTE